MLEFNYSLILPPQPDVHHLVDTATNIAVQNFEWRYITFVMFNSTTLQGVENLLRLYEKSYIIGNGRFYPSFSENTRQYILYATNMSNIRYMLDWMRYHQFDNTGKHIVICESKEKQQCDETAAVQLLWDHKITNVVFLRYGSKDEVLGFSYFPLIEECNNVRPVKLNNIVSCGQNNTKCINIFPMKLTNLHRCPLTVSIYQQVPYMIVIGDVPTGVDGDLLRILMDALNATVHVMEPRRGFGWGNLNADGQWTGSLGDVYNDFANFSMTSGAMTLSRASYFQFSIDYYSAKVLWITHPAPMQPSSLKLLYPVQTSTQIALVMSFLLVVIVALLVRSRFWARVCHAISLQAPQKSVVFYSWLLCMGLPLVRLPTHQTMISIVLLWIWYCFIVRTIYQVCLVSVLRSNYYYSSLDTIRDAYEANYPFGGGVALRDFYIDDPLVFNNWRIVEPKDIIPNLFEVANGKKFVLAMSGENAITLIRTKHLDVHILTEKLISSPTVIFFKKFSPLAAPINAILRVFVESGLVDKFYKDYVKKLEPKEYSSSVPLNTDHYKGCFFILGTGWVTSITFFIFELLYAKYNRLCNSLFSFEIM